MKSNLGLVALHRAASVFLLSLVAACGGGGGADPAPVVPPAPVAPPAASLAITASAARVPAGGAAVAIAADVQNSSQAVSWSLSGPGSLSALTGPSISYVPPAASAVSSATDATITATLGSITRTVVVTVARAAGSEWQVASHPKADLRDVRYLNGRFFAVDQIGTILTSADGVRWAAKSAPPVERPSAIAHGAAGYLAVGSKTVLRSADGEIWERTGSGSLPYYFVDITFGLGGYVAASSGDGLLRSTDGVNWTVVSPSTQTSWVSVAFGGGTFVAVAGNGDVYTSSDGTAWSAVVGASGNKVAYGNGLFGLSHGSGHFFTSSDGRTWQQTGTSLVWGAQVTYGAGQFFLVGGNRDTVVASVDGVTWRTVYSNPAKPFVMAVAASPDRAVLVGLRGEIQHSADQSTWTTVPNDPAYALNGVAKLGAVWAAVGGDGIVTSTDGMAWRAAAVPKNIGLFSVAAGPGQLVAVGIDGAVYTSTDGTTWSEAANRVRLTVSLYAVAYGGGRYVAVGDRGRIVTSTDGLTWSAANSGVTAELMSVAYGNGRFVVVGSSGLILTSTDGQSWSSVPVTSQWFRAVAFGGGRFLAAGYGSDAWASTDGLNWTSRTLPLGESQANVDSIAFANGQFFAFSSGVAMVSEDLSNWKAVALGINAAILATHFADNMLVAVGMHGAVLVSTR